MNTYIKELRTFIKFAVTGVVNTAVDFGALWILVECFFLPIPIGKTLSYSLGILNSFFMNKYWTFDDRKGSMKRQLPRFLVISLVGLAASVALISLLTNVFRLWYMLANIITTFIVLLWNFLANKLWTFTGK